MLLGRHAVVTTIEDGMYDRGLGAAIEPDIVCEIRRTKRFISLAIDTMTRPAIVEIGALTGNHANLIMRQTGHGANVLSDFTGSLGINSRTHGRHHTISTFCDRGLNGFGCASIHRIALR